jgi:hypothetical protein
VSKSQTNSLTNVGGSGAAASASSFDPWGGGGGFGGSLAFFEEYQVSPGSSFTVTVGSAGQRVPPFEGQPGTDIIYGGSTVFGNLLTVNGSQSANGNSQVGIGNYTSNLNNVRIGSAKIKLLSYDSSSNSESSNTYIYKTFLTDINTRSIFNTATGNGYNALTGSTTTINLPSGFSANSDVYVGARVRIVAGPGTVDGPRTVKTYTVSGGTGTETTRIITVEKPYSNVITTASQFILDFDFGQTDSIAVMTSAGTIRSFSILCKSGVNIAQAAFNSSLRTNCD